MLKPDFEDRWRKAQSAELTSYMTRTRKYGPTSVTEYWRPLLSKHFSLDFEYFRDKKVLEIGCGYDGVIHCLFLACLRVGIDPLCHALRHIYVSRDKYYDYVHHMVAIGESLPFKDNSFDIVISYNVIDHGLSPDKMMMEINRVLAEGGSLILEVNTFSRLPKIIRQALHLVDRPHLYHLSDKEVIVLCNNAGFKIGFHSVIKEGRLKGLFNYYLKNFYLFDGIKFLFALLCDMGRSHYICSKGNETNT